MHVFHVITHHAPAEKGVNWGVISWNNFSNDGLSAGTQRGGLQVARLALHPQTRGPETSQAAGVHAFSSGNRHRLALLPYRPQLGRVAWRHPSRAGDHQWLYCDGRVQGGRRYGGGCNAHGGGGYGYGLRRRARGRMQGRFW